MWDRTIQLIVSRKAYHPKSIYYGVRGLMVPPRPNHPRDTQYMEGGIMVPHRHHNPSSMATEVVRHHSATQASPSWMHTNWRRRHHSAHIARPTPPPRRHTSWK
ncbi:unnamed protein product [Meganyctiphanes norvegica]|uniref:Uncharacterized protein n=1 Tax=Meganyctiphanes norvegica TaxID=48144 RepID=A0AAV2SNL0_MEGNR